jgi:hypothetical protein
LGCKKGGLVISQHNEIPHPLGGSRQTQNLPQLPRQVDECFG